MRLMQRGSTCSPMKSTGLISHARHALCNSVLEFFALMRDCVSAGIPLTWHTSKRSYLTRIHGITSSWIPIRRSSNSYRPKLSMSILTLPQMRVDPYQSPR